LRKNKSAISFVFIGCFDIINFKSILMKKACSLMILVVLGISLTRCTKETIDENTDATVIVDSVFYDTDIKPLIEANCIACHGGANTYGGLNLKTYQVVKFQTESGSLINRINNSSSPMPQGGLMSADNRGLFDKWLKDGLPETK
jgi:hypothetical protein